MTEPQKPPASDATPMELPPPAEPAHDQPVAPAPPEAPSADHTTPDHPTPAQPESTQPAAVSPEPSPKQPSGAGGSVALGVAVFIAEVLLLLFSFTLLDPDSASSPFLDPLFGFACLGGLYLTLGGLYAWATVQLTNRNMATFDVWQRIGLGKVFRMSFPTIIGIVGLVAGGIAIESAKPIDGVQDSVGKALATIVIIQAWMIMQAGYARMYAWLNTNTLRGSLVVPKKEHPSLLDYLYHSFTVGATFAVSDVTVTDTRMRWYVMTHSIITFFYNTAVMAIAIRMITG